MSRFAWIFVPLALGGCPADAGEDGDNSDSTPEATSEPTGSSELGCAAEIDHDTTDGSSNDLMMTWGAPCTADDECVGLLGEGAECLFTAVAYQLPEGYCSKPCVLGAGERVLVDDPSCDPNGGIACIGNNTVGFAYCAAVCTDDSQCSRDGYTCRLMPIISPEGDPNFCLMPDCCESEC